MADLRLLLLLVAVDLASKLAALAFLPSGAPVNYDATFQFVLSPNLVGMGTWGKAAMRYSSPPDMMAGAVANIGLAISLMVVRTRHYKHWRKVAVCLGGLTVGAVLGMAMAPALLSLPAPLQVIVLRGAGVFAVVVIWRLVPRGVWKLSLTLLAAAAIGNALSLLYPPFMIVDFMYSRLAAMTLYYGVFNVADLYIPVGWALVAVAAIASIARAIRRSYSARHRARYTASAGGSTPVGLG